MKEGNKHLESISSQEGDVEWLDGGKIEEMERKDQNEMKIKKKGGEAIL